MLDRVLRSIEQAGCLRCWIEGTTASVHNHPELPYQKATLNILLNAQWEGIDWPQCYGCWLPLRSPVLYHPSHPKDEPLDLQNCPYQRIAPRIIPLFLTLIFLKAQQSQVFQQRLKTLAVRFNLECVTLWSTMREFKQWLLEKDRAPDIPRTWQFIVAYYQCFVSYSPTSTD